MHLLEDADYILQSCSVGSTPIAQYVSGKTISPPRGSLECRPKASRRLSLVYDSFVILVFPPRVDGPWNVRYSNKGLESSMVDV